MRKIKQLDAVKAAEYDRAIADLPITRESAKHLLDLSADTEYLLVVDHPYESSMTVAVHMSTQSMHTAVRNILTELVEADSFPPLPAGLRAMGVDEAQARRVVVLTAVAAGLDMTPEDLRTIAALLERGVGGPSHIEA